MDSFQGLISFFNGSKSDVQSAVLYGAEEAGTLVLNDARQHCSRENDSLPDSISLSVSTKAGAVTANVSTSDPDAFGTEYGFKENPPKPFLRPALVQNEQNIEQIFEDKIGEVLK